MLEDIDEPSDEVPIPVMIGGPGYGVSDKKDQVFGGADRLRAEAGRGWDVGRRGVPQSGDQRGDLL